MKEVNSKLEAYKKVRTVWGFNPKTRVKMSKKEYNRSLEKKRMFKTIEEEI